MQTQDASDGHRASSTRAWTSMRTQTVAVVDASPTVLASLEAGLDGDRYSKVVLLDSHTHAYGEIKRFRPHVVIVCTSLNDPRGYTLLTMLKLDQETRDIPVVAITTDEQLGHAEEPMPSNLWLN